MMEEQKNNDPDKLPSPKELEVKFYSVIELSEQEKEEALHEARKKKYFASREKKVDSHRGNL